MHYGSLSKSKAQASLGGMKSVKIKENFFKGTIKPNGNSQILVEKEPTKSLMNTFRPVFINEIGQGNKFRTTKNSPERIKEASHHINTNSSNSDALEIKIFSNERKARGDGIHGHVINPNYIQINKIIPNAPAPQKTTKLKDIVEEANDIESLMRKKILRKKENIKNNILNYSNPYGNKYSQFANKIKLESSEQLQNPSYLNHLKMDFEVSKQDCFNKKSDRVFDALNHKRSISSFEGEDDLLCLIKGDEKKNLITPRVDSLFNKLSEAFDSRIPQNKGPASTSVDFNMKKGKGATSGSVTEKSPNDKSSPNMVMKYTSKFDLSNPQKKSSALKNSNDLSSIVSNISSTIISQSQSQSLNNTTKNVCAGQCVQSNAEKCNMNTNGYNQIKSENSNREGKQSKTSANTQNNSRTNSIEKNILKNSKNLFLNNAGKNSNKATSNISTNNSSSTLLSSQNQNKHIYFWEKGGNMKNMNMMNMNMNMNLNMNNIPNGVLATDQSHSGKVLGFKISSNAFHSKGFSEIPGIVGIASGNISKNFVFNNIKCGNYLNSNKSMCINTNISHSISKKEEKEKEILYTKSQMKQKNKVLIPLTSAPSNNQSKNNSKSVSRIEDLVETNNNCTPYVNSSKLEIKTGKSNCLTKKHIPITTSHSPTNLLSNDLAQNFIKKNSSGSALVINESQSENLQKTKGNNANAKVPLNIQGISKKESLQEKDTLTRQMAGQNDEKTENILENSSDSLKSTVRESNYYRKEMEKISNYIRQYFAIHGEYPKTNIKFYKYGRLLGRGAFGKVNIALNIVTGRLVAIKSFNKSKLTSEKAKRKILYETQIWKNLRHQLIAQIYEKFETPKYIIIVMEYVCGGDLLSFVRKRSKLNESTARFIFKQIIEGLQYIHSKDTVHRDIKLDNILFDLQNNVKICDFGVSKHIKKGDVMHDQCGTPAYIAPEILKNQGYEGFSVDIWSSGVVLYAMLSGTVPFKANNMNDLHKLIIKGAYQPIKDISDEANNLLINLLEVDPRQRFTIDQILSHPWIRAVDAKFKLKMNLFTTAEQILLAKSNIDYRNANKDDLIENFTLRNLDTLQETENQNINTKSIILAPFNSSVRNTNSFLNSDLLIETDVLKFCGKPKELNRNYELNNNGEIDNGIIISPQDGNTRSDNNNNGTPYAPSPFNNSINNRIMSKPISPAGEYEDNNRGVGSPREKEELGKGTMIIKNGNNIHLQNSAITIDEKIIREVEEIGYKKDYVIRCLLNNEINYATTAYYLLLNHQYD